MVNPSARAPAVRDRQGGYALTILVRTVLLVVVLAQLVFLGNRYKLRRDLTEEQLYTLTPSTQRVLSGLQDRLLVECYFTRDDKLPASYQDRRRELRSVLDEYVRRSNGKVQLQFFDPASDQLLKQKAERLQMQPEVVENLEIGELTQQVVWQGLRMRYGGDRQEVIPMLPLAASTFQYEAWLTPRIKDLTVAVKPKVKVMAVPMQSPSRVPKAYNQIRSWARFDFGDLDLGEGKLVPDDTAIVLLFRPRDLNDRAKYALDQFLMRGGKLVVFADTADIDVGNNDYRSYAAMPIQYDTGDSQVKFLDQLAGYGVKVEEKVVADLFNSPIGNLTSGAQELMGRVRQTTTGAQVDPIFYPYLFHALNVNWGSDEVAQQLARDSTGKSDPERAAQYRAAFKNGLKTDHPLALQQQLGPGLFWPCPVDLVDPLPAGVSGDVIARSSPVTIVEKPPRVMNPFGERPGDPVAMVEAINRFQQTIFARIASEPRRQVGLIVALQGTFPSCFAGKPVPPRKPPAAKTGDPLTEKVGKEGEPPPAVDDAAVGPPVAREGEAAEDKDQDPPFLDRATPEAQLVVVGDADFLRDDYLSGAYAQGGRALAYGPLSDQRAGAFFASLLDWLVQDEDLLALRSKVGSDRTIRLGQHDVMAGESAEAFVHRVTRKANSLRWLNVLGPAGFLLVLWLVVAVHRNRRKAAFLRAVGN